MSSAPSIPLFPTPGKDPPPTMGSPEPASHSQQALTLHTSRELSPNKPQENANRMLPPPKPPKITTHGASTSNILSHPSLSQTHSQYLSLQPSLQEEKPRPPFTPFFTLINDSSIGGASGSGRESTIHPRKIHYIFSDDEASDLLTASLIHSIRPASPSLSTSNNLSSSQRDIPASSASSSSATFKPHKPQAEREERVVIVDISSSGDAVTSVSSLSPSWQVLSASIANAPTFDSSPNHSQNQERGLMLKIEGVGAESLAVGEDDESAGLEKGNGDGSGLIGEEEMHGLLEGFDRKMEVLRRVLTARGEKGSSRAEENPALPGTGAGVGGEENSES